MTDEPERGPVITPVMWLRAARNGIFGALIGAGFAVWLALSHRVPAADAGVIGVEMPLAGAALGVSTYLWWSAWRLWK